MRKSQELFSQALECVRKGQYKKSKELVKAAETAGRLERAAQELQFHQELAEIRTMSASIGKKFDAIRAGIRELGEEARKDRAIR